MVDTVDLLFWGMEAAYVVHCPDEAIVGSSFVNMVKKHFWPEYTARKFFGFNFLLHGINITTIIAYEILGGSWIILPPKHVLAFCY